MYVWLYVLWENSNQKKAEFFFKSTNLYANSVFVTSTWRKLFPFILLIANSIKLKYKKQAQKKKHKCELHSSDNIFMRNNNNLTRLNDKISKKKEKTERKKIHLPRIYGSPNWLIEIIVIIPYSHPEVSFWSEFCTSVSVWYLYRIASSWIIASL